MGIQGKKGALSYATQLLNTNQPIRAPSVRHLVLGFASGSIPSLPANLPLLKSASLVGVTIRHFLASQPVKAQEVRTTLFESVVSGMLRAPAIITFPLERAADALAATMQRDKAGKIVVLPAG